MLWVDPSVARGVLKRLAATQATAVDDASDAEPGKILHEARHGEMADLGEVPFRRYYGSVDATPLFVMLAGAYLERTGDIDAIRALWPNIKAALEWIERYGDRDGDGFVEYARRNRDGLVNQGWKDSHDAIFHADGSMAKAPIALVEVQAYVYAAWRAAADIARRLAGDDEARAFDAKAEALRAAFDRSFFDEALGTYVLALDGDKRPCRVRASNAGHALFTGIAFPERAASVVGALMGSSSFLRLGRAHARFDRSALQSDELPQRIGLAARQCTDRLRLRALRISPGGGQGVRGPVQRLDLRRPAAPARASLRVPAQAGQRPDVLSRRLHPAGVGGGRAALAVQSCLGLTFDPAQPRITFSEPVLPPFLDWIVLKGLTVAGSVAEIGLWRSDRRVVVDVLDRRGAVSVVTTT